MLISERKKFTMHRWTWWGQAQRTTRYRQGASSHRLHWQNPRQHPLLVQTPRLTLHSPMQRLTLSPARNSCDTKLFSPTTFGAILLSSSVCWLGITFLGHKSMLIFYIHTCLHLLLFLWIISFIAVYKPLLNGFSHYLYDIVVILIVYLVCRLVCFQIRMHILPFNLATNSL